MLALSALVPAGAVLAREPRVLVVTTSGVEPYQAAAAAARKLVAERWPATPAVVSYDKSSGILPTLPGEPDDIVIAVGSSAVQALAGTTTANLVGCMTMSSQAFGARKLAASLVLEFPAESQIEWLRQILPGARAVGLVFAQAEAAGRQDAFVTAARKAGLNVNLYPVGTPSELGAAADRAAVETEVLMVLADSLTMSPQSAKQMLLSSFRGKVPLVGLSDPWVKAGALYALDWDFDDIGKQCGQLALKLNPTPVFPRTVRLSVNVRTARYMKIELADALIKQAAQLYR